MDPSQTLPSPWMLLPFGVLLGLIALAPLFVGRWWHRNYARVAIGLAAVVLAYYLVILRSSAPILHVAHEYISFICLIGSLFVVSGGIHIGVKGESSPGMNVLFLLVGAIVANVIGTTGASMLLIRPWIQMNRGRNAPFHVVFFIFIISNVGGCLTPIGDPPLFLGYLKGVPFWWITKNILPIWGVGIGFLLSLFYVIDRWHYRRTLGILHTHPPNAPETWRFEGATNLVFLGMILGSVFINNPLFVRESLMITAAVGSWFTTKKQVHQSNEFSFAPIKEVAILFVGIFSTMLPALDLLQVHAKSLAMASPGFFFWSSGFLSSVLDNAPTYYSFLTAMLSVFVDADTVNQVQHLVRTHGSTLASITGPQAEEIRNTFAALQKYHSSLLASGTVDAEHIRMAYLLGNPTYATYLLALSVGSVFFGANTYIGNAPNFMVKAIADQAKICTPSFLGYIFKYTIPIMLPMLVIVWFLFFR